MTSLQEAIRNMSRAMEEYETAQMLRDGASILRIDATPNNPRRNQNIIWAEWQERDAQSHEEQANFYNTEAGYCFDQHERYHC